MAYKNFIFLSLWAICMNACVFDDGIKRQYPSPKGKGPEGPNDRIYITKSYREPVKGSFKGTPSSNNFSRCPSNFDFDDLFRDKFFNANISGNSRYSARGPATGGQYNKPKQGNRNQQDRYSTGSNDHAGSQDTGRNRDPEGLYKALGLTPGATQDEIKKAFRKLSLQYHPDHDQERKNLLTRLSDLEESKSSGKVKQKEYEEEKAELLKKKSQLEKSANLKYQPIANANSVLSDPERRKQYDRDGTNMTDFKPEPKPPERSYD